MIIKTSTAGRTRPSAVAILLRAGAPAAVAAPYAGVGVVTGAEPSGSAALSHGSVVVGGMAGTPSNDAQLRASVRWSDDL